MSEKTKNYEIFKLREDNRLKVDPHHVKRLIDSIKSKNMLELRPILVNSDMEVIDGQHRLLAAKELGVEIYFRVDNNSKISDLILMNIAKPWTAADFLNYYCRNGFAEYVKLDNFIKKNKITVSLALNLTIGRVKSKFHDFKIGKYKFPEDTVEIPVEKCYETIDLIKKMQGYSAYTNSTKFWKGLIEVLSHPDLSYETWLGKIVKFGNLLGPRSTVEDYIDLFFEIYNRENQNRIKKEVGL